MKDSILFTGFFGESLIFDAYVFNGLIAYLILITWIMYWTRNNPNAKKDMVLTKAEAWQCTAVWIGVRILLRIFIF